MAGIARNYNGEEPWSYGNANRIKAHNPGVDKDEILSMLSKNEIYSRFKHHRKQRVYSPIYVYRKRELFQADVVFFTDADMITANDGYKYLFTCIDCFSKMAWVFPMKRNTCEKVMTCFKEILHTCGQKPERLNSDRGSELICKKFEDFLRGQNIHHFLSYSVRKCPIVERFNLTIQSLLYKIMAHNRSLKWVSFIDQAMRIYLNRKHSTIGMSPLEAEKASNSSIVRKNLLAFFHRRGGKKKKPKFAVNDTVRIWKKRLTFHRGYDENYSIEYFKIIKIKTNLPVPRYILQDSGGDQIVVSFFEDEIVKFVPPDTFDIQVIGERATRRGREFLVHFVGYPKKMDQWVQEKNIRNL